MADLQTYYFRRLSNGWGQGVPSLFGRMYVDGAPMPDPILTVKNITKTYPGVVALNDVSMGFEKGEVHALLGENGAGKSTLIKVISGAIEPDSGRSDLAAANIRQMNPALAKENGVAVIYQEFSLVESLSVAQNVFLGEQQGRWSIMLSLRRRAARDI